VDTLSTLELLAEISIGLIGFAGVVTALGRSKLATEVRYFRTIALLLNGGAALFGSLLPIILFNSGLSASTLWISSSVALGLIMTSSLLWVSFKARKLIAQSELPAGMTVLIVFLSSLVGLVLLYAAFFASSSLPRIYPGAVFWSLALGIFHFFILVISIEVPSESQ
jgi:hypothetical protein